MSIKTKVDALCYLLETWATATPRILYHSTFGLLLDPRGSQRFINQVLNASDLESDDPVLSTSFSSNKKGFYTILSGCMP